MCKFHKEVSRMVATDPASGTLNPAHEAVIRVALSRYWLERYVVGGEIIEGYSPYPMATLSQQAAFAASGLQKPALQVEQETREGISYLRHRLTLLEAEQGPLTVQSLGLPIKTARDAFLDKAILAFYQGDPKGDFHFADKAEEPILAPLHRAVAFFQQEDTSRGVLERLVTGRICALYSAAPHQVNQAVMGAYEKLPERAKAFLYQVGQYGGNIAMGGFSGIAGHGVHYGAVLGAGMASGIAASTNFALSGVFLAASYGIWDRVFGGRYRSSPEKLNAFAVQAALTVAVALGGQMLMSHDHGYHHQPDSGHQHHTMAPGIKERVNDLKLKAQPHEMERWKSTAQSMGIGLEQYLAEVCVTLEQKGVPKSTLKPQ
ncbi:MAG: hypothetical protein ACK4NR_12320 [Micavibrio sp.]